MPQWDGAILLWIQESIRAPWLTPIMKFITSLGNYGWIWILITMVLLCIKRTRKLGMMSAISLLLALLIDNVILKNLVARIRPYEVVDGLKLIIAKQKDYSFPSGHSGSSFAAATVLYLNTPKKYGIWAMILALLIALSRLYVGVHYPTDVVAGIAIGILIGYVVTIAFKNRKC